MKTTHQLLIPTLMVMASGFLDAAEREASPAESNKPVLENPAGKKEMKLPGILINIEQHCVDVDSTVCLREGTLELVATVKGGKEHESIVAIDAKPMHVHAALLLLGALPGNPAMRKPVRGETDRWVDVAPAGGAVDVFLVFSEEGKKPVERPIRDFIKPSDEDAAKARAFPTDTFLFTGSLLVEAGPGPRKYACDESGNVISLVTFGDEVLGLSEFHSNENNSLMWQVDGEKLPAVGAKVILRLRPKAAQKKAAPAGEK